MSSRFAQASFALTLAVTSTAAPRTAAADAGGEVAADTVLFVRGSSVLRIAATGKGTPREVATLPADHGVIARIESSHAAGTILLQAADGARAYWVQLHDGESPEARTVTCTGNASLSPNGRCLTCPADERTAVVVSLASGRGRRLAIASPQVQFLGPSGRELLAVDDGGIWASPLRRPTKRRRLAPHRPIGALSVAPDGSRAVGVYEVDDASSLESFRLDGRAARRTLLRSAKAVAWSADSKWLLTHQQGRACIVRAVGGQYKCWRGYTGAAIAADGSYAVLAKPAATAKTARRSKRASRRASAGLPSALGTYDLYRAELAGADAARPKRLVSNVSSRAAAILLVTEEPAAVSVAATVNRAGRSR